MKKQDDEEILKRIILNLATFAPVFLAFLSVLLFDLLKVTPSVKLSLFAFISGFTGIIIIVRKEIPTAFGNITGIRAIVEGAIWVIICWIAAIYFAIYGLN